MTWKLFDSYSWGWFTIHSIINLKLIDIFFSNLVKVSIENNQCLNSFDFGR